MLAKVKSPGPTGPVPFRSNRDAAIAALSSADRSRFDLIVAGLEADAAVYAMNPARNHAARPIPLREYAAIQFAAGAPVMPGVPLRPKAWPIIVTRRKAGNRVERHLALTSKTAWHDLQWTLSIGQLPDEEYCSLCLTEPGWHAPDWDALGWEWGRDPDKEQPAHVTFIDEIDLTDRTGGTH
jgi:hypothetical protein